MPDTNKDWRRFHLRTNVLRLPISQFLDNDYNPQKSFFATMTFIREEDVVDTKRIEFINQAWDFYPPYDGQLQIAVKCAYQGILDTFINLGIAAGYPPYVVDNSIEAYTELTSIWDEIRVVCYSSAAVELNLYAEDYDVCNVSVKRPSPPPEKPPTPPPPPLPPTITPPETEPNNVPYAPPIGDISPPYEGEDDGGNTVPYTNDENPTPPPPTTGDPCSLYRVVLRNKIEQIGVPNSENTENRTIEVFGVVGQPSIAVLSPGAAANFYIECQGIKNNGQTGAPQTQVCLSFGVYLIGNNGYNSNDIRSYDFEIISIESA